MKSLRLYILNRNAWHKTKGLRVYRRKQKRIRIMNTVIHIWDKSSR